MKANQEDVRFGRKLGTDMESSANPAVELPFLANAYMYLAFGK